MHSQLTCTLQFLDINGDHIFISSWESFLPFNYIHHKSFHKNIKINVQLTPFNFKNNWWSISYFFFKECVHTKVIRFIFYGCYTFYLLRLLYTLSSISWYRYMRMHLCNYIYTKLSGWVKLRNVCILPHKAIEWHLFLTHL